MANELDPEIIRQLNEKFTELANITSNLASRTSTNAKANNDAIQSNTNALNEQTRTTNTNTRANEQQSDAIRTANNAIRQQANAANASQRTFAELRQATQDQFKAFQATQRAMEEIDRASSKAAQRERDKVMALEKALDSSIAAVEQFGKAIFDSSKGMSKYTGVVENLTTAVSALLFIFGGPLLKVVGLVVGAMGKLFGAQLEQIESLNKTYETLSEFGALRLDQFGNGIRSITSDVHKFGLTVKNDSGLFTDTLKGMSKEIVALGGTVGEGRGQLADAFALNIGAPIEDELRRLGYNSQTYFKSWAKATQLAIQSGSAVGKSNTDLNRQTNQYLKTLTELSELTGMSRDEQLAIREKIMQDETFYMKRREIEASGDDKALKRFDALTTVTAQFGDGIGGVIKEVTTAGGVVTERAAEINAFTNGAIERATQAYNRGAIDEQQLRKEIGDAVNALRERFGSRAIAILGNDFAKAIGLSSEAMKASAVVEKQNSDAAKNARDTVDKIAKDGAGKERDLAIAENKMAIANQQALEKVIQTTNGPLIGAFEKLIDVTNKLRDAFIKILRMIGIDAEKGTSAESKRRAEETTTDLAKAKESFEFQKKQAEKVAKQQAGIKDDSTVTEEQRKKYQEVYNKELQRTTKFDRERIAAMELQRAAALEEERDRLVKEGALKEEVKQNKELIASKQKISDIDKLIADQEGRRKKVLESLKLTEEDLKGRNYVKNIDTVRKEEQKYLDQLKEQRGKTAAEYADKLETMVKPAREGVAAATGPTPRQVTPTQIPTDGVKELEGKNKEFYDKMYKTLLDEAKKAGIQNAEVIAKLGATQSALETGYGKRTAGAENYFGIKARKGEEGSGNVKTEEWDPKQQKMVVMEQKFRKYQNMQESAADYIKFLQENQRYKDVLKSQSIDEAIAQQSKTGYATDPEYIKKLLLILAQAEKTFVKQNTQVASNQQQTPDKTHATPSTQVASNQQQTPDKTYAKPSTQIAAAPQQTPEKMFDGGIVTKPTTTMLRDGGQDEAVIPLNRLAELLPIKELVDAINRQTELMASSFKEMTEKIAEGNSIGSDQLLYMQG